MPLALHWYVVHTIIMQGVCHNLYTKLPYIHLCDILLTAQLTLYCDICVFDNIIMFLVPGMLVFVIHLIVMKLT